MESPESWFHRRATDYVEAQILFHASQVGVLGLLMDGSSRTATEIAQALDLNAGAADALLDYVFEVDELLDRDADGRYALTEFGSTVMARFSDANGGASSSPAINMFDVRVGAYGPVWQNLGNLLRGDSRYGQDFVRDGRFAETGVSKFATRFLDSLTEHIDEAAVGRIVEVGLTTGLLEHLARAYPDCLLYGVDRSAEAIDRTEQAAAAQGSSNVGGVQRDFFDVEGWAAQVDAGRNGLVYSLHFHELLARGEQAFVDALRELKARLPGWRLLAFEQPRLPHEAKGTIPEALWLYSQSNVLIHHLIGNGRILSREAWIDLGHEAGCESVADRPCNYLGYRAFLFRL